MSLQWKLILQRISLKNLFLIISGISFLIFVVGFATCSCGVDYFLVQRDVYFYEESLDPESCEMLVERIYLLNDICGYQIDVFDCG